MLAESELISHLNRTLTLPIRDEVMDQTFPEKSLWNAVLLQVLKEAEYIRRDLTASEAILNGKRSEIKQRNGAFKSHYRAQKLKKIMESYLKSGDFDIVCDFAGHNTKSVADKIEEILRGEFTIMDKQVKRTFTRKPKYPRKGDR